MLVVDDSETMRREISAALRKAGFSTDEACDGQAGLEKAQSQRFSLIILDVNMPRMNGLEMLGEIKNNPKAASLPVLILTTEAHSSMVARAKQAGVKAWLIKPVKMEQFVGIVQRFAN